MCAGGLSHKFILGCELVRRCWVQQPGAAERNVRRLRRGQIVRRATKSGLGTTVPKLVHGMCRHFGPSERLPFSRTRDEEDEELNRYTRGNMYYTTTCQLLKISPSPGWGKTGNLPVFP